MLTVRPPQLISERDNSYCGSSYLLIRLLGLVGFALYLMTNKKFAVNLQSNFI